MTFYALLVTSFFFFINGCGEKRDERTVVSGIVEVQEVDLGFEESGVIQSVDVDVGNWVKASQNIASLDNEQLTLEYEAQKYEYERTKADLENLSKWSGKASV